MSPGLIVLKRELTPWDHYATMPFYHLNKKAEEKAERAMPRKNYL